MFVHGSCRRRFTDPKRKAKQSNDFTPLSVACKKSRPSYSDFDWKNKKCYCSKPVYFSHRLRCTRDDKLFRRVETMEIKANIIEACDKRADDWSYDVKFRILNCIDLVTVGAVYHCDCHVKFITGRDKNFTVGSGRVVDKVMLKQFEDICEWLEESCELVKLHEAYQPAHAGNSKRR